MDKLKPKKSLGQHFLTDKQLAQKIVRTSSATETDTMVEIGPGMGILTQYLIKKFPNFQVVEVDTDAVKYLQQAFPQLVIVHQDVLKWQPSVHIPENSFLIGNLPYNISSPIFFHILDNLKYVKEGVFMIQKEVAERICASKGSKTYGILSVLLGYYFELKYEFSVPPTVFSPPPKVMSAVLSMKRRENVGDLDFKLFKHIIKSGFGQRRKTLRNSLKAIDFQDFPELSTWLNMRAEQLGVEDFVKLTQNVKQV